MVTDASGKLVQSRNYEFPSHEATLNLSSYSPGLYIATVLLSSGNRLQTKIVLQE
jgi:hypothetical protein